MSAPIGLRELQQRFSAAMFADDQQLPQAIDALAPWLDTKPGLSTATHIGIYRSSIHGQLSAALGDIYPVCKRLVGERFFAALCGPYVISEPSTEPDIGGFGAGFAAHIAAIDATAAVPYLADVARLEWAWHRVFHGPDQQPMDMQALAWVPAESQRRLQFQPPANSWLIDSDYPVHTIWQRNQLDWDGEEGIDLNDGGVHLLVWRSGNEMRMDPLDEAQWQVLTLLAEGLDLDGLGARLGEQAPEVDVAIVLPKLLQNGWIGSFSVAQLQTG